MRSVLEGGQGHVESITHSRKMFKVKEKKKEWAIHWFNTQQEIKFVELTKQEMKVTSPYHSYKNKLTLITFNSF